MSGARRLGFAAAAALACACATLPGGVSPRPPEPPRVADAAGRPAHVLLVTVAGLTSDRYLTGSAMPVLAALASEGVAAEQVEPVAPAASYPAHATLVTGVPPVKHAIVADRLLGMRGVRRSPPSHVSQLHAATLWQRVAEGGGSVASFDWPTTLGAELPSLLPDVKPVRSGERWQKLAEDAATPWIAERLRSAPPAAEAPGPTRDALLVDLACAALAHGPRLVLLRLRGPEAPLVSGGPSSPAAAAAFTAVDAEIGRLVRCADQAGILAQSAFVVTGDRAIEAVHTEIRPNVWLRAETLVTVQGRWKALARSNGRSAFVYADEAATALQARKRLETEAKATGAFRVVSADEMIARGADPDAWFGLQAEPGFVFANHWGGAPLTASAARGAGGSLAHDAPGVGLVAAGQGIRRGVRVPRMSQLDVAPTLAPLLDVKLEAATGHELVGLLRLAPAQGERAAPRGR